MKTLTFAILVPLAVCAACARNDESLAAAPPANTEAVAPARDMGGAPARPGNAAAAAGTAATNSPKTSAQVTLASAPGSSVAGNLAVNSEGTAVTIRGEITGLNPGKEHGFHVHEFGECAAPDFQSAGAHFNPTNDPHGGPDSKARHAGDIPNAKADNNGRATINITVEGVTLEDKDGAPNQLLGKSLVVHAMPDDYKTQPSGGSGDRIACGVIR